MFAMYEGLLPEIEQAIENTKDLIKTESDPKIKKKLIIKKFELESQKEKYCRIKQCLMIKKLTIILKKYVYKEGC